MWLGLTTGWRWAKKVKTSAQSSDARRATLSLACQAEGRCWSKKKLQCAGNLDTALAIAKEAGYEVTTEEWLKHHEYLSSELTDHDLEGLLGGNGGQDRKETKRISCKNS